MVAKAEVPALDQTIDSAAQRDMNIADQCADTDKEKYVGSSKFSLPSCEKRARNYRRKRDAFRSLDP